MPLDPSSPMSPAAFTPRTSTTCARRCGSPSSHGVKVGAHPSLPDLQGFGRREMKIGREELANCLIYQIGALKGFLEAEGMTLNHIKPHGSLYGMAARDRRDRQRGLRRGGRVQGADARHDRHAAREASTPPAAIASSPSSTSISTTPTTGRSSSPASTRPSMPEVAADRARAGHQGGQGAHRSAARTCASRAETICVHSDTPNAVEVAQAVTAGWSPKASSRRAPRFTEMLRGLRMAIKTIDAPLPGTFYRRPSPDQPPFKGEGDAVAVGDIDRPDRGDEDLHEVHGRRSRQDRRIPCRERRRRSWPASRFRLEV